VPSYRESKIVDLIGTVDGANDTFTTPANFFLGSLKAIWNGAVYDKDDPVRGWDEPNSFTVVFFTPPQVGDELQCFYLEQDPSDTLSSLIDVKGSPVAPSQTLQGSPCVAGGAWACDCDGSVVCQREVNCQPTNAVGDWLYVSDEDAGGRPTMDKADPGDSVKLPAAGVIVQKVTSTVAVVQFHGPLVGIVTGLTLTPSNDKRLYLGVDGRAQQSPPALPNEEFVLGLALGADEIDVNPQLAAGTATSGGGGSGWIKIQDVEVPGGTVSDEVWQDPAETVLQGCTVSSASVEVVVASSYPLVNVGGVDAALTLSADEGHYSGNVPVTLPGDGNVVAVCTTPDEEQGASDTVAIVISAPPILTSLSFSGEYPDMPAPYPGKQVALKAGDNFLLAGTTDKPANAIEIQDSGAFVYGLKVFAAGTSFIVTGTAANRGTTLQALAASARARDADTGALGPARATNELGGTTDKVDLVNLTNRYPAGDWGTPSYPGAQGALKNSEQASVPHTVVDADFGAFSSPNSQLSVTNPSTLETPKTVTRIAGDFNDSVNNLQGVFTRAENGEQLTRSTIVKIAHVLPLIDVVFASRLRSGGNDGTSVQGHTITIQSNQPLLNAPSMDEDTGGGTFIGSWAGGPSDWTRTLQVHDDDTKGSYTFQGLTATNLSGLVTNTITSGASYVLGGFVSRTLTLTAFQNETAMNVVAVTYAKVSINWEVKSLPNQRPVGTTVTPDANSWCLHTLGPAPVTVRILDTAATGSSSVATDVVMEEAI